MTEFEEELIKQLDSLPERIAKALGEMARDLTIEEQDLTMEDLEDE